MKATPKAVVSINVLAAAVLLAGCAHPSKAAHARCWEIPAELWSLDSSSAPGQARMCEPAPHAVPTVNK